MVYGEIGRFTLKIEIKVKMSMFWFKLITGGSKLPKCKKIYRYQAVKQKEQSKLKRQTYCVRLC